MNTSFRADIRHEESQQVYDFWLSAHRDDRLPRQCDLDLVSIPKLLPNCFIMDAIGDDRFRYRFVGTAIERHIGMPLTGKVMDEMRSGRLLETLTKLYGTTQRTGRAGFVTTQMPTEMHDFMLYHRLSLPISDDGETVNKIFGGHYFEQQSARSKYDRFVEDHDKDEIARVRMIFDDV